MNYIEQINNFWAYTEQKDISAIDIANYFAILNYCNNLNWLNPFVCHWEIVCQRSKVSKNAYYKSLERLEDIGLITYDKGEKNSIKKPKLFILQLKNKEGIIKEQRGNKEGTKREQHEEQKGNLYKEINLETNKLLNLETNKQIQGDDFEILETLKTEEKPKEKSTPKKEKVVMPFSGDFQELWDKWKNYKRLDHKFNYKSLESEQAAINSLVDLANGNEENAKLIIMQSLANGWKGFFKLKNEQPGFGGFTEQQLRDIYSPIPQ